MTVYLTKFTINTARRGARKLLTSPQALHAAVLASFANPGDHTGDGKRTLWRVDHNADHQVQLYIVSPGRPDLTHLIEQAGWPTTETWQTHAYQPFLDTLQKKQIWAFRLTANPVRNGRKIEGSSNTQRFGAVTVEQQIKWLTDRAERNGFTICHQGDGQLNLVVRERHTRSFVRAPRQRPVTLCTATYDGVLEVHNPGNFRRVLTGGFGHARAYGCGLLTLAHVEEPR